MCRIVAENSPAGSPRRKGHVAIVGSGSAGCQDRAGRAAFENFYGRIGKVYEGSRACWRSTERKAAAACEKVALRLCVTQSVRA